MRCKNRGVREKERRGGKKLFVCFLRIDFARAYKNAFTSFQF